MKRNTLFYFNFTIIAFCFLIILIVFCFLLPICEAPLGVIYGDLISEFTGTGLKDIQVILCSISRKDRSTCILQAEPSAITDQNGEFTLADVPSGEYLLMYGFPEELTMESNKWENVEVGPLVCTLTGEGKIGNDVEKEFWSEGYKSVGERWCCGGRTILLNGYVTSTHFGISMMAEDSKIAPYITVTPEEISEIHWIVRGR